MKKDQFVTKTN